tara:strand:- start:1294 stop:1893 length:600 start_codon:yes stop_codon:yes gene_type:complete
MITFLKGKINSLLENSIEIDVSGVGYNCIISSNTSSYFSTKINQEILILTYHHINETTQSLFGFHEEQERQMFKLLISVSGVGPKTAIQFFSHTSADNLKKQIKLGKVDELTAIPGIGNKTAKRIIIDIKEKIPYDSGYEIAGENNIHKGEKYQDAIDALLVLGYVKKDIVDCINKIISKDDIISTPELIKKVLNKIGK